MNASATWSLPLSIGLFALATVFILVFGVLLTRVAARLAELSGLGETLMGALLLGATTSLPEVATSVTAATGGHADLAVSNAVGSVAGQTAFLALADMAHRHANLEHAAASAENLLLATFLIVMLAIPMLGMALPEASFLGVHVATPLMLAAYVQGIRMVSRAHARPMWLPRRTRETRDADQPTPTLQHASAWSLWARFGVAGAATAGAGWLLARAAVPISVHTGLSETLVGGVLTGLAGSMPELVTAVAAVRLGALSLAVGDILGGNCFDALIVGFSDLAYPGESVYAAVGPHQDFLLALTILLAAVLLMGLLYREKHGVANIGLESFLMLLFYLGGITLLVVASRVPPTRTRTTVMTDEQQILLLTISLAIGLLFGIERGWHSLQDEKPHVAGVRTFGLIGLLGGVTGLVARHLEQPVYGFAFLAIAAAMVTAYVVSQRRNDDPGITSLVAGLLAFGLGTLAALGHMVSAAAAAVVSALLLGFKPLLHRGVAALEEHELQATLKLLLITVVLLPVLPDQGYGPKDALNPYEIWWMVVLIAAISFSGYFAVKIVGADKGVALTALLAGLASSTALTLHFSRLARRQGAEVNLLASGVLLATATLFPRILVITAVLSLELARALIAPMAAMALAVLLPGLLAWRYRDSSGGDRTLQLDNPLDLGSALRFGAGLAVVMLLARLLRDAFGGAGVLALAGISGLIDLNAITLSVGRMSGEGLGLPLAVAAIVLASVSNGVFKSALAWVVGGARLGLRVTVPVLATGVTGPAALWFSGNWPAW